MSTIPPTVMRVSVDLKPGPMVAAALVDAEALGHHGRTLVPGCGDAAVDGPLTCLHPREDLHLAAVECKRSADTAAHRGGTLDVTFRVKRRSVVLGESATKRWGTATKRGRRRLAPWAHAGRPERTSSDSLNRPRTSPICGPPPAAVASVLLSLPPVGAVSNPAPTGRQHEGDPRRAVESAPGRPASESGSLCRADGGPRARRLPPQGASSCLRSRSIPLGITRQQTRSACPPTLSSNG
jgi:hypothetical protein